MSLNMITISTIVTEVFDTIWYDEVIRVIAHNPLCPYTLKLYLDWACIDELLVNGKEWVPLSQWIEFRRLLVERNLI